MMLPNKKVGFFPDDEELCHTGWRSVVEFIICDVKYYSWVFVYVLNEFWGKAFCGVNF